MKPTKKPSRRAELVVTALSHVDGPFQAVDEIMSSRLFPNVSCESDFERLPDILKKMIHVQALILHSSVNGLFGLFSDWPVNVKLNEIERHLTEIGAERSVRFLTDLKAILPKRRFPVTAEEAAKIVTSILRVQTRDSQKSQAWRERIQAFGKETTDLPEELRHFLRLNRNVLVEALETVKRR